MGGGPPISDTRKSKNRNLCESQVLGGGPPIVQAIVDGGPSTITLDKSRVEEKDGGPSITQHWISRKKVIKGSNFDGIKEDPVIKSQIGYYDERFPPP